MRSLLLFALSFPCLFAQTPINSDVTYFGKWNASGASHTVPTIVVSSTGALPTALCVPGELAMVTSASLGQQMYENSGTGTCIWTQQSGGSGSMTWPILAGIPVYTGTSSWGTSVSAPSGTIVGTSDTQTLTNKTLDGVTPTIFGYLDATSSIQTQLNARITGNQSISITGGCTGSGTTSISLSCSGSMTWPSAPGIAVYAGSNIWGTSLTAPSGTIVGTSDTQTLTNKTLDGVTPTIFGYLDATSSIQTQLNSTFRTNAASTGGAVLYDFSASTLKIPTKTGFTASAISMFGLDSTTSLPHIWAGSDQIFGLLGVASTWTGTQTFTNVLSSTGSIDFGNSTHTRPTIVVSTVGSLPGTCSAGELAFVTGATAGKQIYECSALNTWTQETGGGGGGTVNSSTSGYMAYYPSTGSAVSGEAFCTIAQGCTNSSTAAGALINLFPTATRVGDMLYCSTFGSGACTAWTLLPGETNATTQFLGETSGNPSWIQLSSANLSDSANILFNNASRTLSSGIGITAGNGSVINYSGSGIVNANVINGNYMPNSAVVYSNSSGQPVSADANTLHASGYASGGGSAQSQTVSLTPSISSLLTGQTRLCWLPSHNNTGSGATLQVNSTSPTVIVKIGGAVLAANDILTSVAACVIYDGTYFELQNPQSSTGTGVMVMATSPTLNSAILNGPTISSGTISSAIISSPTINGMTFGTAAGSATVTQTIASGTFTIMSTTYPGASCSSTNLSATGVLTTDVMIVTPNAALGTPFEPLTSGNLSPFYYPAADNIYYGVCNSGISSQFVALPVTFNWKVIR